MSRLIHRPRCRAVVVAAAALMSFAASGCDRPSPPGAAAPAAATTATTAATTTAVKATLVPAVAPAGFSAFHGGGPLLGVAEEIAPPPMATRWTYKTDEADPGGIEGGAAIAGGVAYVGDDRGYLHAIDLATGKARWKYKSEDGFAATPLVVGGRVLIGDLGGLFHAVSAADGKKLWTFDSEASIHGAANYAPAPAGTPGSGQGYVLFGNDSGGIFCLDASGDAHRPAPPATTNPAANPTANPTTAPAHDVTTAPVSATAPATNRSPASAPTTGTASGREAGKAVATTVATTSSTKPDEPKIDDKAVVWKQQAGDRVNGAPAVSDTAAFFSGCDAQLRALSLKDGSEIFAADMGALSGGSPAIDHDRIVIGTDRGRVVCFSGDGKRQLWEYTGVGSSAMVFSSPAVAQGIAVVGARDRSVYALDVNTGLAVWTFPTRGDVDSSPVISGGRVYFGSKDRKLYVLDLKTGKELWQFTAGRPITAPPAIGQGVLVIGDSHGTVYCLQGK